MHSSRPYICTSCLHRLARTRNASSRPPQPGTRHSSTSAAPAFQPTFSSYTLHAPPTPAQLSHANAFFTNPPYPTFLLSTPTFRHMPPSSIPEICFLGRSNVGKSSLLNALFNRTAKSLAHVSSKPGRTKALTAFGVAGRDGEVRVVDQGERGKVKFGGGEAEGRKWERWEGRKACVVVDMPGYGKGSREEWGTEVVKYLGARAQLRRTFVLLDATHPPKTTDLDLLAMLRADGVAHQIVLTKIDKLLFPNKPNQAAAERNYHKLHEMVEEVRKIAMPKEERGAKALPDVLMCSTQVSWPLGGHAKIGIDGIRWAVLQAAGLDTDEQGRRRAVDVDFASGERPLSELRAQEDSVERELRRELAEGLVEEEQDAWAGGEPESQEKKRGRKRRTM